MKELHAVTMKMDKKQKVFYSLFRVRGVDFAVLFADKRHISFHLQHETRNIGYNYLAGILLEKILRAFGRADYIVVFDERSTKVESKNSLKDYLQIKMRFDLGYDGKMVISQEDSRNAYGLQAADLIANISYRYATNGSDAEMFMHLARRAVAVRFPSRVFDMV